MDQLTRALKVGPLIAILFAFLAIGLAAIPSGLGRQPEQTSVSTDSSILPTQFYAAKSQVYQLADGEEGYIFPTFNVGVNLDGRIFVAANSYLQVPPNVLNWLFISSAFHIKREGDHIIIYKDSIGGWWRVEPDDVDRKLPYWIPAKIR